MNSFQGQMSCLASLVCCCTFKDLHTILSWMSVLRFIEAGNTVCGNNFYFYLIGGIGCFEAINSQGLKVSPFMSMSMSVQMS